MKRLAMLSLGLAYAFVAAVSVLSVARDAPALSPGLRSDNVYGDWRVPITSALFHRGEYDFQIGFSLLQTDAALVLVDGENLPSTDVFERNIDRAETLFRRSLLRQPGHAATWSALVWTHVSAGNPTGATLALEASSKLAPINRALAPDRLAAAEVLDDLAGGSWTQSELRQAVLANDLATLQRFDPAYFQLLTKESSAMYDAATAAGLISDGLLSLD